MAETNHQHLYGNVHSVNGIKVAHQTHLEVHQHFITPLNRAKLHKELMDFKESDPEFFKAIQEIAIAIGNSFMFVKFDDEQFKRFYEIKNILFSLYQEKEKQRLSVSKEKAKVAELELQLAVEKNRVSLIQQELQNANGGLKRILKQLFNR